MGYLERIITMSKSKNTATYDNLCSSMNYLGENGEMAQKLMNKLKDNFSDSINNHLSASLESLTCRTAADFVELAQKNFQQNIENIMKLNNDFIDLATHISASDYRHSNDCLKNSVNNLKN